MMGLQPDSSNIDISNAYEQYENQTALKKAYNCLKTPECRSEYTRFGSGLQLNDANQELKFDWRLSFTVGFYMLFAFV